MAQFYGNRRGGQNFYHRDYARDRDDREENSNRSKIRELEKQVGDLEHGSYFLPVQTPHIVCLSELAKQAKSNEELENRVRALEQKDPDMAEILKEEEELKRLQEQMEAKKKLIEKKRRKWGLFRLSYHLPVHPCLFRVFYHLTSPMFYRERMDLLRLFNLSEPKHKKSMRSIYVSSRLLLFIVSFPVNEWDKRYKVTFLHWQKMFEDA